VTRESARRRSVAQITLLSLSFAVLIVVSVASVYWLQKAREDAAWVTHTLEVENRIATIQLQMRRAESWERGFVITGQPDMAVEFERSAAEIVPTLQSLRDFIADNPVQRPLIESAIELATARIAHFKQVIALVQDGRVEEARQLVRNVDGRTAMGDFTRLLSNMRTEESRLFVERTTEADRSQSYATIITTTGSGLVLVLAGLSIFLVRRSARARDEAEEQLRQNNLNLESTVEERTADLREANEEIQRFAYIVSHDLRSPLVNIMGFTSELEELRTDIFRRIGTLSRELAGRQSAENADSDGEPELEPADRQLSDDFTEALGFIKSSIGKMDRLISAILNLTREGRRQFQPVRIDTRELIENIASTVAHQAAETETQIHIEPLPEIVSDRLALEQIFSNLIDNALKYLKDGVPGEIVIRGRQRLGFAIFEVSDNGRGIDPKDHQRIFDLFRRAGTQDRPGQGIGLAHVRALVRRLGGTMSVASALGEGSTFTITLPARWTVNKNQEERA